VKKLLAAFLTLSATLIPTSVKANQIEDHKYLIQSIIKVGVPVILNTRAHCNDPKYDGSYSSGLMFICQDNARLMNGKSVQWTANDLDTLRHEAHHLVQDCAVGGIADKKYSLLFTEKQEYARFVIGALGEEKAQLIWNAYKKDGYSDIDILMELEAFAVAETVDARTIANKVLEFCTNP
jgi:hypothetical protein